MTRFAISILGCACSAVALTGCVAYQPRPLDPARELDSLRQAQVAPVTMEHAALGTGPELPTLPFDATDGLSEPEVVAVALSRNPELRAARSKIGEANAALISAGLWPNPEVGVGWRGGSGGASGYTLDADFLFELLRPGERDGRRNVATARTDEARAEMVAAEHRVAAEARQRWLAVLAAEQVAALLNEEVTLRNRAVELVRRKRELGEATELEFAAASLEAAEVRRERRRAEADLETARRELNRSLGLPPTYKLPLTASGRPIHVVVYDEPGDDELDRRLLAGRQELTAKQAIYRRTEQELRLAVLQQYPKLKLGPSFGTEPEGTNYLGVGASLELPIFDRAQGRIAEAAAARDTARAEFVSVLHRLRADAFEAREQLRRTRGEVEEQERDVLPLVRRSEELFEGAYRARELSVLDWVTAQQRALKARRDHLDSLIRYRKSVIELEAATGMAMSQPTTPPSTGPTTRTTINPPTDRRP